MSAVLARPDVQSTESPCLPEPSRKLPPTDRDFEIYEAIHVAGCSTRSQADLHQISQTRVRQIVCRVVEWLSTVIPPQAKIAREQEVHLARQIAANRFQHQYEQMTTFLDLTRESKYAGLRMRITTAQARLGAVSGLLDGLAADAIEGIPVPVWQPPAVVPESTESGKPADESSSPIRNRGTRSSGSSEIPNSRRPIDADQAELLNSFRNIWPRTERVRLAVELEEALHYLPPEHREAIRARELKEHSASQLALEAAVRAGHIPGDEAFLIDPDSYSPPVRDCSPKINSLDTATVPLAQNHDTSSSYDSATKNESDQISPAEPLLTSHQPLPVTALTIAPNQPGATISTASSPSTGLAEPSRPASV